MKTLDVSNLPMVELSEKECAEINGGWIPVAVGVAIFVIATLWPKDAN